MSTKRIVQWGTATKRDGQTVRRSTCNRYELMGLRGKSKLFTVVINPDARGSFKFRPLYIERTEDAALDKLDIFETARRSMEALAAGKAA